MSKDSLLSVGPKRRLGSGVVNPNPRPFYFLEAVVEFRSSVWRSRPSPGFLVHGQSVTRVCTVGPCSCPHIESRVRNPSIETSEDPLKKVLFLDSC